MKPLKIKILIICTIALSALGIFYATNVSKAIDAHDIKAITASLALNTSAELLQNPHRFEEQIKLIQRIQNAALQISSVTRPIPQRSAREPLNLLVFKHGSGSDRSRFLDKAFRALGFEARYASLYQHKSPEDWAIKTLLQDHEDGIHSHALVEVKTEKGWIIVDSISPWIGLTDENEPIGLKQWNAIENKEGFNWQEQRGSKPHPLLNEDFIYVYGLYSRHGQLYRPYVFMPDVNWIELLENL